MLVTITTTRKAPRHPTDSLGLPLPEPSWPDPPGSAGALEPVRRFCNTVNREQGAEAWRTPEQLDRWLDHEGYRLRPTTRRDLGRVVALRDAIWHAIDRRSFAPLGESLAGATATVVVTDSGDLDFRGRPGTVDELVIRLVMTMRDAQHDDSWSRLKTCVHCQWVFYDTSKNRSGRWCSMQACGGREKAKAYRRRRSGG